MASYTTDVFQNRPAIMPSPDLQKTILCNESISTNYSVIALQVYPQLEPPEAGECGPKLASSNNIYVWAELAMILEYPYRFSLVCHMLGPIIVAHVGIYTHRQIP